MPTVQADEPSSRGDALPLGRGWSRFADRIEGEGTAARRAWRWTYILWAVVLDAGGAALAGAVGVALGYYLTSPGRPPTSLPWLLALPFPWLAAMLLARTYEERFLWVGVEEYRRVLGAAVAVLAAAGATSWIVDDRLVRACIVLTLLLATVITLLQRRLHRHRLHRERT